MPFNFITVAVQAQNRYSITGRVVAEQTREPVAGPQRSTMFLPLLAPLTIDGMGNFAPVLAMVCYGYWLWSEKMANTLPVDYKK